MKTLKIIALILSSIVIISCQKIENKLCEEETKYRKYDFDGIEVYTDIEDGIKCAKERGMPIFVLFTGFGCVGDTSYERKLFEEGRNRKIIAENFIPIVLYVDDRKELQELDKKTVIRKGKERKINTIGHKNTNYEIEVFKQNSQPLLAILDQQGQSIIKPIGYKKDSRQYHEFLKEGLKKYQLTKK